MRGLASAFVLVLLLACPGQAFSQAAIAAASVDPSQLSRSGLLTLRPAPGLELLARKVARVLALRSDTTVQVGGAPPPEVIEAVPAGHVAMVRDGASIQLVMGAAFGGSIEAQVKLGPDGEADPRSLALAVEALRDRELEIRENHEVQARKPPPPSAASEDEPQPTASPVPKLVFESQPGPRDDGWAAVKPEPSEPPSRVEPNLFLRLYGGASPQSNALRSTVATGGGLCVKGQCVQLAFEYPVPIGFDAGGDDVRFRYPTVSCSFYSHPLHLGRFTPALSVGFLSRIGRFEKDMGMPNYTPGLETDLGVRGTIEGSYALFDAVDLVAEAGLDYALDRWELGQGDSVTFRGPRATPWLQGGIRIRPY